MTPEEARRRVALPEFVETGYLHEVNRRLLHPLGLALEVVVAADGSMAFGGVWDHRDDPGGVFFERPDAAKARRVQAIWEERAPVRRAELGYMVQPAAWEPELWRSMWANRPRPGAWRYRKEG